MFGGGTCCGNILGDAAVTGGGMLLCSFDNSFFFAEVGDNMCAAVL